MGQAGSLWKWPLLALGKSTPRCPVWGQRKGVHECGSWKRRGKGVPVCSFPFPQWRMTSDLTSETKVMERQGLVRGPKRDKRWDVRSDPSESRREKKAQQGTRMAREKMPFDAPDLTDTVSQVFFPIVPWNVSFKIYIERKETFLLYCHAGTTETHWKQCCGKPWRMLGSGSQRVNIKANRTPASYLWKPKPLASFLSRPTHCYFKHALKRNVAKLISVKFMSTWIKPLPFGWAILGLSRSASHGSVRHPERLSSTHHWARSSLEDLEGTENVLLQQIHGAAAVGHTWNIGVTVARCVDSSPPSSASLGTESSHREKIKKKISLIHWNLEHSRHILGSSRNDPDPPSSQVTTFLQQT